MTTVVTADWHLSDNPRDAYRLDWVRSLRDMIVRTEASHLLILGDLCEEKDRHGAWLVNTIVDELTKLAKSCEITILKGNHDYIDVESPFYAFLGRLANVEYIGAPLTREALSTRSGEAWGCVTFLPHTPNYERDWANLVEDEIGEWVFCHNTFEGAIAGFGRELKGIPVEVFPSRCKVISGDVHVPQTLGNITYVGAPYTVDFGDAYEPRILIINKGKVKSYSIIGPQKRLIEVDAVDQETFDRVFDRDDIHDGDIVKVRVTLAHDDYQRWPLIKKSVYEWGEKMGVQVHTVVPNITAASRNQRKRKEDNPLTDEDLLEEYAKHRGVDKRTLKTGLILLRDA
jgi:hypothetical protein